jgi:hypothetical protein
MAHIVRNETWGTVDLDTDKGRVFVRQDWHYIWQIAPPMKTWTHAEEQAFHQAVDRMIWGQWSAQARIRIQRDVLAKPSAHDHVLGKFSKGTLSLTFDIRQVRGRGHWEATVTKVTPVGKKHRAEVKTETRQIFLFSTDQQLLTAKRMEGDPEANKRFSVPAHEFGHTLENLDEYRDKHPEFNDVKSIMNIGRQLRPRHLQLICETLGTMIPGYAFTPVILAER